jgi:spore coat protein A, manganese oxidase
MKWTRRDLLRTATGAAVSHALWLPGIIGCNSGKPLPRLQPSRLPLPEMFQVDLPRLHGLTPSSIEGNEDRYKLTANAANAKILPGYDTTIWGFNGTFPGPTIEARRGRRVLLTIDNELPVPIVNHLHGGRTPPSSDGYPTDLVLPKQDWSAGHMHDRMANIVKGSQDYIFRNNQRAATLWYHDHRMDFTGPQLWRGLAGFYILRDDEEARLPLPNGDKEIALMICDRSFDADGSLLYPSMDKSLTMHPGVHHDYMGGVLGDVMLCNGAPWPRLEVANTRYRFRILNASNARHLELTLDPKPKEGPVILQIGSDGGLLERAVPHRTLPIAPAERFDVIIDFSRYTVGDTIILRNRQAGGSAAEVMRFDVVRKEKDESFVPETLSDFERLNPSDAVTTRHFDFSYGGMDQGWVINGRPFDPERMDARPKLGSTEIWRLRSDVHHPLHLHLAHFQVLSHAGRPRAYDSGWKDTVSMFAGQTASILVKFQGYRGRYVFHCHNLEHEDMAMMGNFEVV